MRKFLLFVMVLSAIAFSQDVKAQKNFTKDADAAFLGENYFTAIDLYKKSFTKEKNKAKKAEILFKIAECYRFIEEPGQAEVWYQKAVSANYQDPIVHLLLGDIIKEQERYDEALVEYQKYANLNPSDPRGETGVKSSKTAQEWKDNPTKHLVNDEVLLNSKQYDFSPTFADKKFESLIFTSSRSGSAGGEADSRTGESFSDLYYSIRDKKGKWSEPVPLNAEVNSAHNEGAASLNRKYSEMYFTKCINEEKKNLGCQILKSKKAGQGWGVPEPIAIAADTFTVGHPALSPEEDFMLFSSDIEGGQGGKDLWYITYDEKANIWGAPVNLGPQVNTAGDEMFPYVHDDGSIYFSSNGHAGMGGLDMFRAEKTGDKKWANVENMKYPLNSAANDFGIIFEGNKQKGYFTSNRNGSKGGDDIYSFYVPSILFAIQGTVNDVDSKEPLEGARVKLVGSDGSEVEVKTDKMGYYEFAQKDKSKDRYVVEGVTYKLFVSREGFLNSKGEESTVGLEESTTFVHDFGLQSISKDEIRFPEVLYDLAKWTLRPESKDSLNFLYQVLIDNPTIVIELSAHTDSRGSDASNEELSQKRAQSCVEYLIERGIDKERLTPKGYGERMLIFNDEDIAKLATVEEKEAAHQKNRRTVFKVLNTNFVPKAAPAPAPAPSGGTEQGK